MLCKRIRRLKVNENGVIIPLVLKTRLFALHDKVFPERNDKDRAKLAHALMLKYAKKLPAASYIVVMQLAHDRSESVKNIKFDYVLSPKISEALEK